MSRGAFITFEGVEGAGKSTQIRKAVSYLLENGLRVHVTREPGGSPLAEKIRDRSGKIHSHLWTHREVET